MRPGGKSNGESPFFETPNLSFEGRVRNVASPPIGSIRSAAVVGGKRGSRRASSMSVDGELVRCCADAFHWGTTLTLRTTSSPSG